MQCKGRHGYQTPEMSHTQPKNLAASMGLIWNIVPYEPARSVVQRKLTSICFTDANFWIFLKNWQFRKKKLF
jgi:hypothetical protein